LLYWIDWGKVKVGYINRQLTRRLLMSNITKNVQTDILQRVAEKHGVHLNKAVVKDILNDFLAELVKEINAGGCFLWLGVGRVFKRQIPERKYTCALKGQEGKLFVKPAHEVFTFRAYKNTSAEAIEEGKKKELAKSKKLKK
jgi:nucleoid DNA-binding protein